MPSTSNTFSSLRRSSRTVPTVTAADAGLASADAALCSVAAAAADSGACLWSPPPLALALALAALRSGFANTDAGSTAGPVCVRKMRSALSIDCTSISKTIRIRQATHKHTHRLSDDLQIQHAEI